MGGEGLGARGVDLRRAGGAWLRSKGGLARGAWQECTG
jgi:hypothetical protein